MHQTQLNNIKKNLHNLNKQNETLSKLVAIKESEMEKYKADKLSVFRKCKFEQIDVPL